MMGWIRVSERLPEMEHYFHHVEPNYDERGLPVTMDWFCSELVLASTKEEVLIGRFDKKFEVYSDGEVAYDATPFEYFYGFETDDPRCDYMEQDSIIAWMPLPEPYKEER